MTVIEMSREEIDRAHVLRDYFKRRISAEDAGRLMGVTRRQVFRLARAYRAGGAAALVSKRRGRSSNRSYPPAVRTKALALIRANYDDFGPTLAAEKLAERHDLRLGVETVRRWMMAEELWQDRRRRRERVYQPRYRRPCRGELVQIDGSEHWWFEERSPQCTLLAFVDDATSRLMHAQFVPSESTFDYFRATRAYLARYGKPIAFYSDKHAVFRVNAKEARAGSGLTQFGRALSELNVEIICANAPQSKGRVERCFGTLQDRLVKEMRLEGIDTIEAANTFLPGFLEAHNARFARAPLDETDKHRPLALHDDLDATFAWKEERTVSTSLTVQYDRVLFLLEQTEVARELARKRVQIWDYPDGRLEIRHKGVALPYRTFDKVRQVEPAAVVDNKRLGAVLDYVVEQQRANEMRRSGRAPRRRGQTSTMFKAG